MYRMFSILLYLTPEQTSRGLTVRPGVFFNSCTDNFLERPSANLPLYDIQMFIDNMVSLESPAAGVKLGNTTPKRKQ